MTQNYLLNRYDKKENKFIKQNIIKKKKEDPLPEYWVKTVCLSHGIIHVLVSGSVLFSLQQDRDCINKCNVYFSFNYF
jgi:hypothetical protein